MCLIHEGIQQLGKKAKFLRQVHLWFQLAHFDQQDEDNTLFGNATLGVNRSDEVQNSKSQYDILPPII
jgi:hypothetical protein